MFFTGWRPTRTFKLFQCITPSRGCCRDEEGSRPGHMPELPADIWVTVFHLLDLKSLLSVEASCRDFRDTVRCNPPLFKSAYTVDSMSSSGQAAKLLDAYIARPDLNWRRACMFRVGLEALCDYARRREEFLLLSYASNACTQTLASDKAALKLLAKKAKQHNASMNQVRSRGDLEGAAREFSAHTACLARKAGKESSVRIWKVLLPHFKARMKEVAKDEAAAKGRLLRIYSGFPSNIKARCTTPHSPLDGRPFLCFIGQNDNSTATGNVIFEIP